MADLKNVIKGLESCITCPNQYGDCDAAKIDCPYRGIDCHVDLMRDALALLKAQEPRVMTLEEARNVEVVWVEDRGTREVYPCIVKNNMNDSKLYKYGVQWRCWTSRPTDAQRKEVKWDE